LLPPLHPLNPLQESADSPALSLLRASVEGRRVVLPTPAYKLVVHPFEDEDEDEDDHDSADFAKLQLSEKKYHVFVST
jgi:hypothetical protein